MGRLELIREFHNIRTEKLTKDGIFAGSGKFWHKNTGQKARYRMRYIKAHYSILVKSGVMLKSATNITLSFGANQHPFPRCVRRNIFCSAEPNHVWLCKS